MRIRQPLCHLHLKEQQFVSAGEAGIEMGFRSRIECSQLLLVRDRICAVCFAVIQIRRTIAKQIVRHCRRGVKCTHILVKFASRTRLVGTLHAVIHGFDKIVVKFLKVIRGSLAEPIRFPRIEIQPPLLNRLIYLCLTYTARHHAHSLSTMNPLQLSAYCRRSVSFSSRAATLRLSSTYCPSW